MPLHEDDHAAEAARRAARHERRRQGARGRSPSARGCRSSGWSRSASERTMGVRLPGCPYVPRWRRHRGAARHGCTSEGSTGHCDGAGPNPTVVVHLGDGNDLAESNNDHAVGHGVQFYGEDGDDDLESQGSSDLLDGGPGNDRLQLDDQRRRAQATSSSVARGRLVVARHGVRRQRADQRLASTASPMTASPVRATTTARTSRTWRA